jgi:hypothetical protein
VNRTLNCKTTKLFLFYVETKSQVRISAGSSGDFDTTVGVHQRSAMSALLFITVLEEATKECRGRAMGAAVCG